VLNEQLQEIIIDEASLIYEPENNFIRNFVSQIYTLKRWTPEKQMEQSNNELKMLDNILQRSTKSKKERNAILKELLADFEDDFDSDFEF
jgi:ABC-type proline/glycine betaine transport system ATPase subunit